VIFFGPNEICLRYNLLSVGRLTNEHSLWSRARAYVVNGQFSSLTHSSGGLAVRYSTNRAFFEIFVWRVTDFHDGDDAIVS